MTEQEFGKNYKKPDDLNLKQTKTKRYKKLVEHHEEEEEREVFQVAGKELTEKQKQKMAKEFREIKEEEKEKI